MNRHLTYLYARNDTVPAGSGTGALSLPDAMPGQAVSLLGVGEQREGATWGEVRASLRSTFESAAIPGIVDVRLLPRHKRHRKIHKVFIILGTHDLARDRRVIELMAQFEGLDYDLVPRDAVRMVPDDAASVL